MPTDLTIDIQRLSQTRHRCDCCSGNRTCCCSVYDIGITEDEVQTIIGALPLLTEFCPWLNDDPNVFEEEEDGSFSIDKDAEGDCVFSYRSGSQMLCALHSAALKEGLPPHRIKPAVCTLWPLSLSEAPDPVLSICDDAYEFHCVGRQEEPSGTIPQVFAESIADVFGPEASERPGKE